MATLKYVHNYISIYSNYNDFFSCHCKQIIAFERENCIINYDVLFNDK